MVKPEHLAVVERGATYVKEWRRKNPKETLDLSSSLLENLDLRKADLSGALLDNAILYACELSDADLHHATLVGAELDEVYLHRADLSRVDLSYARFMETELSEATLSGAQLLLSRLIGGKAAKTNFSNTKCVGATFEDIDLTDADFSRALMAETVIANCNLANCRGIDTIAHDGPSTVDFRTILLSFRGSGNRFSSELETFLLNSGIPKKLFEALPRILAEVKYYNCFLCYGNPDLNFAKKLVKDLNTKGVSCWLYSMDYTPGRRTWREISHKRREAEKMIVLCSVKALVREGVLKEIEAQIDENPEKIVPVSLDSLWKEEGFLIRRAQRDLKPFLLERNYADFSNKPKYEESLDRLLKGLELTKE